MKTIQTSPQSNPTSLYQAILSLRTLNEARRFFRDLLTAEEIQEFSKRWETAGLLQQKVSYSIITQKTGLSSTTIARIQHWLQKGKGGYKLVLHRKHHNTHAHPVRKV